MESPRAVFLNAALFTPMHARTDPDEAATRETIEPDGWLHTGDLAVADEEGHFLRNPGSHNGQYLWDSA